MKNTRPETDAPARRASINEDGAPLFPWDSVVGIIDNVDAVHAAVCDLVAAGFPESGIHVLAGEDGERLIDRSGGRHGFLGRVARTLQSLGEERAETQRHIEEVRKGHFVVVVPTKDDDRIASINRLLRVHGGHGVSYYTRMTTRTLEP